MNFNCISKYSLSIGLGRASAGGHHFRNFRIIVAIKIRQLRKTLAKEIYIAIYFRPSCLFTFFRVSRTLPDQTILGFHFELVKSLTEINYQLIAF